MSLAAFAKTNSITIPCRGPIEAPAGGLRASSDGDAWEFSLVPGDHTELYDQHWFFNGIAPGTPNMTPAWGQLLGGQDGSNALSWLSPTEGGSYSIKVQAKRRCTQTGGGGGGDAFDPNFEISWGVEVAAKKTWDVGSAIAVTSLIPAADTKAAPGDAVPCSVTASDNDHWKKGDAPDAEQDTAADELTYQWSASGGFFSGSGASVSWTPPNATGTYTLTCIVDDKPTTLSPIDDGTRDDAPLTVSVEVEVPPRTWSAGFGIGKLLDDQGRLLDTDYQPITTSQQVPAENGRLIAPQDRTKPLPAGATAWPVVEVRPGEKLGCALEGATDFDHWKRPGLAGTDNAIGQPATNSGQYTPPYYGRTFGDEDDELTYTWSKSGGGNASSGAWEGTTDATVSGASAVWIAPAADPNSPNDNQYTLTCTIDDKPTAVVAPDAPVGTTARDDAALTRTVTVQVVDATSWMALSLYKDKDGHADPDSPVMGKAGGTVWIATDVQIGGKTKIVSPLAPHLRIEELDGQNLHGDDAAHGHDNHAYLPVPLSGWVEWNFQTNQWGTTPLSLPDHNDDETPKRYRCYVKWNTTTSITSGDPDGDGPLHEGKLWGHNAPHNIQLEYSVPHTDQNNHTTYEIKHEMEFQPLSEAEQPRKKGPNLVGVDVGNLVITDVSTNARNADYIKFDAESTDSSFIHPSISFTIKDAGDPHRYRWWVWVKPSRGEPNSVELTGIMAAPGIKTVTINQPQGPDTQDHNLTEWGTYIFDIRVEEIRNDQVLGIGEHWIDYRSQELLIPPFYSDNGEQKPGHYMKRIDEIDQGKSWVEIGYYLDDNQGEPLPSTRNANTVQVDFLGPAQQVLMQEDLQTQVRVPHVGIDLYTLNGREGISETQQDGTFRAIFMAEDGHGSEYRDHRNKRMMPVNKAEKFIKYFHVEDDWMVSPADGALFPQARSDAMEEAFQGTGWRLVNASTSPKQVLPAACTAVPYEYILGGSERRNYSQDHFYYYTARKTPAYVTQNKWGRYVHVIGANWEKTPTADISQGREMGYTDHDERYSFIYVKEILNKGHETHGVRMTAIHEVGHQFNPGHQHGKEATPAEEEAYEKGNITVLRNYRSRPLPGVTNPGREGFYQCVMYPGFSKDVTLDHLFCPYHKEIIRGYQGW